MRDCRERPARADIFYPRPWSIFDQHWLAKKAGRVREALRGLSVQERRELQHSMRAQLAGLGDLGLPDQDDGSRCEQRALYHPDSWHEGGIAPFHLQFGA